MAARRIRPILLAAAISLTGVSIVGADTHSERPALPPLVYQGPAYVQPETARPPKRRVPAARRAQETTPQPQGVHHLFQCAWAAAGEMKLAPLEAVVSVPEIGEGAPPSLAAPEEFGSWVVSGQYVSMLSDRQFVAHVTGPDGERINTYLSVQTNGAAVRTQIITWKDKSVSVYSSTGNCEVTE